MNSSDISSLIASLLGFTPKGGFIRGNCIVRLQNLTSNNPALLSNPGIFYRNNSTGELYNDVTGSPRITLIACKAICGSGIFGLYVDATARLLTWLVPTFLLMTSMQYAPIGWRKFAMVPHLIADPIHSTWSLLSKVETMNRCLIMARNLYGANGQDLMVKDVGLIIACIEELYSGMSKRIQQFDPLGLENCPRIGVETVIPGADRGGSSTAETKKGVISTVAEYPPEVLIQPRASENHFSIDNTPFCLCTHECLESLYSKTAQSILDARVSGTRQTIFNIGVYIVLGVLAAFIPAFGGNPSPSGGKIATSILLSWLLPVILLSSIVGQFNTSRNCLDAITVFKQKLEVLQTQESPVHQDGCGGSRAEKWIEMMSTEAWGLYHEQLAENGSIYSFRPPHSFPNFENKAQGFARRLSFLHASQHIHPQWILILLAVLPICTSFTSAFIVLWSPPTYFSCRHVMVLVIFVSWLVSYIFTSRIAPRVAPFLSDDPKTVFNIILIKDSLLASTIISLLIASACGLFNSCFCWSGWWFLRMWDKEPQVQLNPESRFQENVRWIYPVVVSLTLGAQLMWFLGMLYIGRKVYFGMMQRRQRSLWDALLGQL